MIKVEEYMAAAKPPIRISEFPIISGGNSHQSKLKVDLLPQISVIILNYSLFLTHKHNFEQQMDTKWLGKKVRGMPHWQTILTSLNN